MVFALAGCSGQNGNTNKKALLVVSFGSSFVESRQAAIDATEQRLAEEFSEYDFYNAYTSQIIIDIYEARDGKDVDSVSEAIERIYKAGYGEVLIVPTLVINGEEKDDMIQQLEPFVDKFAKVTVSTPLLTTYDDYLAVVSALSSEMPETSESEAVVLLGHGTHHHANSAYGTLDYVFKDEGYSNVFVGTVEGFPTYETVLDSLKERGITKVTLIPAMIVAGDHAHNDMAGDTADSWKNLFKSEGFDVDIVLKGLGELEAIQDLFVQHAYDALAQN
ncbi:MAG: sirohydrochlorin cobaltochelatase [Clostridia bacterium]|nr:sirohydrochlorin cobaltochelatase [Clostridia bacterium]